MRPNLGTTLACLLAALPVAACGDSSGGDEVVDVDAADLDAADLDAPPPIDAAPGIDGAPAALDCLGDPLPTTAPATITITGEASSVSAGGSAPVNGAAVTAFDGTDTQVGTTTSDAQGAYSITVDTNGVPVDGYVRGVAATYLDTYLYPPNPLSADTDDAPLLFVSSGTFDLLEIVAGVTQDAGNGWMGVVVIDCAGNPVAGATVTTTPAGTIRYTSGDLPSQNATSTDASGVAMIFNLPAGDVVIDAELDGMSFREHTVEVRADVVTTSAIAPGPVQ